MQATHTHIRSLSPFKLFKSLCHFLGLLSELLNCERLKYSCVHQWQKIKHSAAICTFLTPSGAEAALCQCYYSVAPARLCHVRSVSHCWLVDSELLDLIWYWDTLTRFQIHTNLWIWVKWENIPYRTQSNFELSRPHYSHHHSPAWNKYG